MIESKITLLLMAGLPGAGKSTLANALGRDFNWHVIDKDMYREVLLRQRWDVRQRWDDVYAGRIAYELSFAVARNVLIKQQASVILDSSALHRFILENASMIASREANVQIKVILCVVDRDERQRRLQNRSWQTATMQVDPETIAGYLELYKHLPSNTLILFTNEPFTQYLETAKEYLR